MYVTSSFQFSLIFFIYVSAFLSLLFPDVNQPQTCSSVKVFSADPKLGPEYLSKTHEHPIWALRRAFFTSSFSKLLDCFSLLQLLYFTPLTLLLFSFYSLWYSTNQFLVPFLFRHFIQVQISFENIQEKLV